MVFEGLSMLLLELFNSHIWVEVAFGIHFLKDLYPFLGLQVVFVGMLCMNNLEVSGDSHEKNNHAGS